MAGRKSFEMIDLKLILVGSRSKDWFDNDAKPPPFSFVVLTPSRPLRFTAPDLQTYVACVQGLEAILAEAIPHNPTLKHAEKLSSPSTSSSPTTRLRSPTNLENETKAHFTLSGLRTSEFLGLYDSVLLAACQDVIMDSWGDCTSSSMCALSRQVRTSHRSTSSVPGIFTELSVSKIMSAFLQPHKQNTEEAECLFVLEENLLSGAPYADYVKIVMRWCVVPTHDNDDDGREGVSVTITCGIGMVKETVLRSRLCSEALKGLRFGCLQWEVLARQCLVERTNEALWHTGTAATSRLLANTSAFVSTGSAASDAATAAVREAVSSDVDLQSVLRSPLVGAAFLEHISSAGEEDDSSRHSQEHASGVSGSYDDVYEHPQPVEGFICPECGEISGTQGGLVAHFTIFHSKEGKKEEIKDNDTNAASPMSPPSSPPSPFQDFVCPECFCSFHSPKDLTEHFDHTHGGTGRQRDHPRDSTPADLGDFMMSSLAAVMNVDFTGAVPGT